MSVAPSATVLRGFAFSPAALAVLESLPPKLRGQVTRKARALQLDPHPRGSIKLKGEFTGDGEQIYRERSGDYRIFYVVRASPSEVVVVKVRNRKDSYR